MKRMVLVFLLVLALITAAFFLLRTGPAQSINHTVRCDDGTTLTLREVTFGREHRYHEGKPWERLLDHLPRPLLVKLYGNRRWQMGGQSDPPSLVLWLERKGNGPRNGDPQLLLCDATGFAVRWDWFMTRLGKQGDYVEGWQFPYWPRRAPTFKLQIYELGSRYPDATLLGEFTLRNPTPGNYPVWDAPPPPLTAWDGDLAVTLTDVVAGVGRGSNRTRPAVNPTHSETAVSFRLERNGQPTEEWPVIEVEARDATGNVFPKLWSTSHEGNLEVAGLTPHPWPAEAGWKLRAGFSQCSNFVASETWTLHGLTLSQNVTNGLPIRTNLAETQLEYTGLNRKSFLQGRHHFNFRMSPARPDYQMTLVQAVDDQGRKGELKNYYTGSGQRTYSLDFPDDAKSVDLTVAYHKTRYVEFLVKPRIEQPPSRKHGDKQKKH